jgi:importin subunit alpha-6/7
MASPTSPRKFTVEEFVKCKEVLLSGAELERFEIITRVRKASSIEDSPPLEQIRKSEIIPILMTIHKDKSLPESVIQDILWTLTNVASGSSEDTMYIVKLSGIDYFIEFLGHPSEAIWGQVSLLFLL